MAVRLFLQLALFAHFDKTDPLKSKIKVMTSKLDNKAGDKQVISGCEFFMAVPSSKVGRETGAFYWGIGVSLD